MRVHQFGSRSKFTS